jgi:selenocysteine lyase/cysteine desulfurase
MTSDAVLTNTATKVSSSSSCHIPEHANQQRMYLNHAAQAPQSKTAQQAGIDALVHADAVWKPSAAHDDQTRIRILFAQLLQAPDASTIAIMPSTAFCLTWAAVNIQARMMPQERGTVLVLQDQMCSAVYPWQTSACDGTSTHKTNESSPAGTLELQVIPYPKPGQTWTDNVLDAIRKSYDSNSDDPQQLPVKVACLPPLHWSDGALLDLVTIGQACREYNILLLVDATQAVGILPCNVQSIQPAVLVASSHKWLRGPAGTALVYVDPSLHDVWQPLDRHGRGRLYTEADPQRNAHRDCMGPHGYPTEYFADARKFDSGGKPNEILLPILRAAMEEVVRINMVQAQLQLKALMTPLLDYVASDQDVFNLTPGPHAYHIVGLRLVSDNADPSLDLLKLQAYLQQHNVYVAVRCGALRISPYLDTTDHDIQVLIQLLQDYLSTHHSYGGKQ